ncbi:large ribosomal subunit protein eL27x-like [Malania oleifera]|uniref:large ribosomal subunit protein eL27x-like n=1 Tax=Malania oleifera TaxID=397392 RepID=UPI0025AE94AA|nr:large ribosomal subunit protein eL27x-like [Malania oleifera]
MVKFLKPNKVVVLLQCCYAGCKAVIIRLFDDGTRDNPYGHYLVARIAKYSEKVIRKDSTKKTAKKSHMKAFIKLVNYNHIIPMRYTLDVDLKYIITLKTFQSCDKKVAATKETKAKLEERFKTGKNRWFFIKLSWSEEGFRTPPVDEDLMSKNCLGTAVEEPLLGIVFSLSWETTFCFILGMKICLLLNAAMAFWRKRTS